jgi:hypothetical protein
VLEAALFTFGAGTSEEMIVAELVAIFSFLYVVQYQLVNGYWRVQATRTWVPRRRQWLDGSDGDSIRVGFQGYRQSDLWRGTSLLRDGRV